MREHKVDCNLPTDLSELLSFSLREEVAKFLTDYCCSPKPLKAENVSDISLLKDKEIKKREKKEAQRGGGSHFHCRKSSLCKSQRWKKPPTNSPITLPIFNLHTQISLHVTLNESQKAELISMSVNCLLIHLF